MARRLLLSGMALCLLVISIPGTAETVETERLSIRNLTRGMSPEMIEKFGRKTESTLAEVLTFWSADARTMELGKIAVELDYALPKGNSAIFLWRKENGRNVRVVRVFGGGEHPFELAHKLTHALFPNPDKLIRNMMGEASEKRFGNPLSFPMCGFDNDEWVMALLQVGSYTSLARIGPNHSDWGMAFEGGVPKVKDRAKQHASYVEAGSFGEFLVTTYGTEKIKEFSRQSRNTSRPWQEVFGVTLESLEAKWLETLRLRLRDNEGKSSTLVELWKKNPDAACYSAQDMKKARL